MKLLAKLVLFILLPWLVDGVLPRAPAPIPLPAATSEAEEGHGAYCATSKGAVFLGRDVPELGSYRALDAWCSQQGGSTRWSA